MDALEFHAYWNGEDVAALFQSIVGIIHSAPYLTLLLSVVLIGFVTAMTSAAIRNRGGDVIHWFFAAVFLYMALFVPKTTVTVIDERAGYAEAVDRVPLGIAFTASVSSTIGAWLAESFETAFTNVDAAKFTKFGLTFPERAAEALRNAGPLNPEVRAFTRTYVERCVTPELVDHPEKLQALMTAPDIPALINEASWVNPARFLMHQGTVLYCDAAGKTLLQMLREKEIPAQEKLLVTKLAGTENAIITAAVRQAVPESEALMYGVSRSMEESLMHSLLMSAIPDGIRAGAERSGAPLAAAVQMSKAQGNLASEISYRTMKDLATAFLPKIRNIIEFILIASSPIVFLMMVALGTEGARVLRTYVTLFLWLALWAPMAAIVNFLILHIDKEPMNQIVAQFGGVTMAAMSIIREEGATSQAIAGYVMLLIPVISFVLAKATDMGMVSLASSVMQPAQSAAAAQSSSLAMGNISAGNASVGNVASNNTTGNMFDQSIRRTDNARNQHTTPYGIVTRDTASGTVTGMQIQGIDLGYTPTTTMGTSSSLTNNIASSTGYSRTDGHGISRSETLGSGESTELQAGSAFNKSETTNHQVQEGISNSSTYTTGYTSSIRYGINSQASVSENAQALSQLHINAGGTPNSRSQNFIDDIPQTSNSITPAQNSYNTSSPHEPINTPQQITNAPSRTIDVLSSPTINNKQPISSPSSQRNKLPSKTAAFSSFDLQINTRSDISVNTNTGHSQATDFSDTSSQTKSTHENNTLNKSSTQSHSDTLANTHTFSHNTQEFSNHTSIWNGNNINWNSSQSATNTTTSDQTSDSGLRITIQNEYQAMQDYLRNMSHISNPEEALRELSTGKGRYAGAISFIGDHSDNSTINPTRNAPVEINPVEQKAQEFEQGRKDTELLTSSFNRNVAKDRASHQQNLESHHEDTTNKLAETTPYPQKKQELKDEFTNLKRAHEEFNKNVGVTETIDLAYLGGLFYNSPNKIKKQD